MEYNQSIDTLAAQLLADYNQYLDQEPVRTDYLPDKAEIVDIIQLLMRLLFPGYFGRGDTDSEHLPENVPALLSAVQEKLQRQICRALNLNPGIDGACAGCFDAAGQTCRRFLNRLPDLLRLLHSDVQAAYDGDPAARSRHEIIFAYPGILAVGVYRLAHELYLLAVPLIPRIMTEYAHSLTGIDIHPGAEIGHHFFIDHGTGIVIGETTVIGPHVKLYQGVTLGALSTRGGQGLRDVKRHPTLEAGVTVYSGASILGGNTVIGKESIIGGNVFITQSVPPGTRVNLKNHEHEYRPLNTTRQSEG